MTQLMTLSQMSQRTGLSIDVLRKRRERGTLGIEPVDVIAGAYVFEKDSAETWIKYHAKP